jgi:hypothetical protein
MNEGNLMNLSVRLPFLDTTIIAMLSQTISATNQRAILKGFTGLAPQLMPLLSFRPAIWSAQRGGEPGNLSELKAHIN